MRKILLFGCLLAAAFGAQAETRYVTDELWLTLRAGATESSERLKVMKSGTPLEVLEEGESHVRVRTEDGVEGWVMGRFLVNEPIAADRLEKAVAQLAQVQQENDQFKERLKSVRQELRETEKERKRLDSENTRLKGENENIAKVAARPLELDKENKALQERNEAIEKELAALRKENKQFRDTEARDWFLTGAGVLLGGMLLGLIIPKVRWRRRSEWFS